MRTASAIVLGLVGLAAMWMGGALWDGVIGLSGLVMVAEWVGLCGARLGARAIGILYIGPAVLALVWLRGRPGGLAWLVFLAAIVWAGDIGAYFFGRWLGGPRLAPGISPGKTWSGALGGTACAVMAALALPPVPPGQAALAGLLLSLVAQAGDLLESAAKRHFGVKDSSRLIPGHGGLLDRLDGVLTAAPLAAILYLADGPAAGGAPHQ